MMADPFSEILKFANAQSVVSGGFTAGGSWAIRFPAPGKLKFFGVVKGRCWLSVEGTPTPVQVEAGDVFLLSAERSFVLANDLGTAPVEAAQAFANRSHPITQFGSGDEAFLIGGHVQLDAASKGLVADILPALFHV
ncbi:MAG: AraC family transcriptional regulator, partial [Rhizobacter sp.]|nr:AraC family transcriptional regulator [Rhizobacter sp.]